MYIPYLVVTAAKIIQAHIGVKGLIGVLDEGERKMNEVGTHTLTHTHTHSCYTLPRIQKTHTFPSPSKKQNINKTHTHTHTHTHTQGYIYAGVIVITGWVMLMLHHQVQFMGWRLGLAMRTSLEAAIFRKVLRMPLRCVFFVCVCI